MPNWCMNKVILTGHDIIHNIHQFVSTGEGKMFSQYVPAEDSIVDHCNKWGTKWDVSADQIDLTLEIDTIALQFLTAWTPPIAFFETLVNNNKGLHAIIEFADGCGGFIGMWDSDTGEEIWNIDDPDVPWELKETFGDLYEPQ